MKTILTLMLLVSTMICVSQPSYTVDPNYNHRIPLDTAIKFTKNYRHAYPGTTNLENSYNNKIFDDIQAQTGCIGVRIYYGIDSAGRPTFVLVGRDANNNDMWQGITAVFGDRAICCSCVPPNCANSSPLNTD